MATSLPKILALIFATCFALSNSTNALGQKLTLEKGDRICIIGNTLAERMQHDGWLETRIQARFPQHQLVFRNLGFSGDEIDQRIRSKDFGSPDQWLTKCKADVVFAFFGFNESFGGEADVDQFKTKLESFIDNTLSQKYNGESTPQLVLFGPQLHEKLSNPALPDPVANNRRLELYAEAMSSVAREKKVPYVDLYTMMKFQILSKQPLTFNGIHFNELGNRLLAEKIDVELFEKVVAPKQNSGGAGNTEPDAKTEKASSVVTEEARLNKIRAAVLDRNFYWFHRYRTTDGYSTYGGRADLKFTDGQTNREVMDRELLILEQLTELRDPAIWAAANGQDYVVDDSKTADFIPVISNKPGAGEGGKHLFLSGKEAIEKMTVMDGFQVQLFASEEKWPELASPVQMSFDTQGRLWVAAWPSYPHWKPKDEMNDKLLIFTDTDNDGEADEMKVFADGLHNPTGFEFWGGGVLVAQAPDIWFLKDTDGDDVADIRKRVLHGIDSADTHHTANSFTLGPGGNMFFQEGTFHHTQVENPRTGVLRSINAGVFRFNPRSFEFDVYVAYGFANPHGHSFDYWGQDFVTDGTGNVNYYATPFSGRIDFPKKHSGYFPFFQQRIRPSAATEIISSRHFPAELQGNYLIANVIGFRGLLHYEMSEDDSGFSAEEIEPIVYSSDPNFRPVDMEFGPDGALYFVDWQNPIIGHMQHNLRDPNRDQVHGRVYRISHKERPLVDQEKIADQSVSHVLDLLKMPEYRTRYRARIELSGRTKGEVTRGLKEWVKSLDQSDPNYEHHLLEALWIYQHHHVANEELLNKLLNAKEPRARAAATRVLCYWRDKIGNSLSLLRKCANDPFPRVRLEAVRACSFFDDAEAAEIALEALKHPTDKFINYCLNETLRQLEPQWKATATSGQPFAEGNPEGVKYILSKLSTSEVARMAKSKQVYYELLAREGVLHDDRFVAARELAQINGTDVQTELLQAIERVDRSQSSNAQQVLADLAHTFLMYAQTDFAKYRDQLSKLAANANRPVTRQISYATLIAADQEVDKVWDRAVQSWTALRDLVDAVPMINDQKLRAKMHPRIEALIHNLPEPLAAELASRKGTVGRYVRIEIPGRRKTLTLAEVEVFSDTKNVAISGKATQSATSHGGVASRAIDGNKSGVYSRGGQTHTPENRRDPWWELDLGSELPIEQVKIWNRDEQNGQFVSRLNGFTIKILDANRNVVFQQADIPAPKRDLSIPLTGDPVGTIQRSAIYSITFTGVDEKKSFDTLSKLAIERKYRHAAIKSLSRMPRGSWNDAKVESIIEDIIASVEKVPPNDRTSAVVLDELALANRLTAALPLDKASATRKRLRQIGVNVIVLRPVPHRMIYDRAKIYVEAGKPVQIVFENNDIMPHNVVFTEPGALTKVGLAAEEMATQPDATARHYVPNMREVMHYTKMLQPSQSERLTFTAPKKVGEYPYVCTFPGHWRRMYGTMHVVEDLDSVPPEELAPPVESKVQARPFVRDWKLSELENALSQVDSGRDFRRAELLFKEISCYQCHQVKDEGKKVGPDLKVTADKLAKGDLTRLDILKSLINPSEKIDEEYQTWTIQDIDGRLHTGVIEKVEDGVIHLVPNPLDAGEKVLIPEDDVEGEKKSKISMMPAGLANTLTKDEILDLILYVESAGNPDHEGFKK